MTDSNTTLLPCPFCGGEASKRLFYKGKYMVHCNVCNAGSGDVCDTKAEAIEAWNTRAAHGTLTAEQVRDTVEKHWHDLSADYDIPEAAALPEYSYDWQAIADELNATLGGGECENVGEITDFCCSECGARLYTETEDGYTMIKADEHTIIKTPNYCPNCGKVVKR